jgi:hypothetical protein
MEMIDLDRRIRTGSLRRRRVDRHQSTMNGATIESAQVAAEDILGYEFDQAIEAAG